MIEGVEGKRGDKAKPNNNTNRDEIIMRRI
jgi:hypothetical protein